MFSPKAIRRSAVAARYMVLVMSGYLTLSGAVRRDWWTVIAYSTTTLFALTAIRQDKTITAQQELIVEQGALMTSMMFGANALLSALELDVMSEVELRAKLAESGYPPEKIAQIVADIEEQVRQFKEGTIRPEEMNEHERRFPPRQAQ
jgi:hypothetical protein